MRRSAGIELRPTEPADRSSCARVLYEAFAGVADRHRFERDFPALDGAEQLIDYLIGQPSIWGVVALLDGRVAGLSFLDERDAILGVGPVAVAPEAQGRGVGRRLMEAVLERGAGAEGIRLLQDTFNTRSFALYASLGFEAKEPVALLSGSLAGVAGAAAVEGVGDVGALALGDLEACARLCVRVHGFARAGELRDAVQSEALTPRGVWRDGRLVAYATTLTSYPAAHAVGESEADLRALIAAEPGQAWFLLPVRQAGLLRWCLAGGLRIVKPMTYMVTGSYREPAGAWIPSVLY